MKFIMGIARTFFGIICILIAFIFVMFNVGKIAIKEAFNFFEILNNEIGEDIKEYYRGLEKIDNE